jgi:hypothetical protein
MKNARPRFPAPRQWKLLSLSSNAIASSLSRTWSMPMLSKRFISCSARSQSNSDTLWNFNKEARNISQPPAYTTDLMFETIWANPFAASIGVAIPRLQATVHYANGNTTLKSEGRQPVHADLGERHLRFPYTLVANYYLVGSVPSSGPTEVWVGSHRNTSIEDYDPSTKSNMRPELVEARRGICPPVQPTIERRDPVLRDVRLWHASMPNRADAPLVMLVFVSCFCGGIRARCGWCFRISRRR